MTLEEQLQQIAKDYADQLLIAGENHLYHKLLKPMETGLIQATMRHSAGNQTEAASRLTINRATLRSKLKRHDLMNLVS